MSCLLLLEVIHCLGRLSGGIVAAALSLVLFKGKRQDLTPDILLYFSV